MAGTVSTSAKEILGKRPRFVSIYSVFKLVIRFTPGWSENSSHFISYFTQFEESSEQ